MKRSIFSVIALITFALFAVHAQEAPEGKAPARELPGWGQAIDPDHDCKFDVAEGSLVITVPGGTPHDLAADIKVTNAPRVLQAVDGDFAIQVKVEGGFAPGGESTKPGRTGYNGAALIAMVDEDNVVTLARAVLQRPGGKPQPYANFEIRVRGKLLRIGVTGDHPIPIDGPIYLRLERRGAKFVGAVSDDGSTWGLLAEKDVPEDWPKEMKAGVAAISTSKEEFKPSFSKLKVDK